jgi:hypothetical protein
MAAATTFRLGGSHARWLDVMVATAVAIRDLPEAEILHYEVRGPAEGVIFIRIREARSRAI